MTSRITVLCWIQYICVNLQQSNSLPGESDSETHPSCIIEFLPLYLEMISGSCDLCWQISSLQLLLPFVSLTDYFSETLCSKLTDERRDTFSCQLLRTRFEEAVAPLTECPAVFVVCFLLVFLEESASCDVCCLPQAGLGPCATSKSCFTWRRHRRNFIFV